MKNVAETLFYDNEKIAKKLLEVMKQEELPIFVAEEVIKRLEEMIKTQIIE